MNNIVRSALRMQTLKPILNAFKTSTNIKNGYYMNKQLSRSLWSMCNSYNNDKLKVGVCHKHSNLCNCGCGKHSIHSKGNINQRSE